MDILRSCISRSRGRGRGVGIIRSACGGSFRYLNSAATNRLNKSISASGRLIVDGGAEVVGCSHGWVALFNKRNNNLFLSDPVTHEEIKLPPVNTLPDPEFNLDLDGQGSVSKVILSSSSPVDDECRAMMTFGPANRLAFCLPGRSSEWTPIGDHYFDHDKDFFYESVAKFHEDLVYCPARKVFTSVTAAQLSCRDFNFVRDDRGYPVELHDWDVQDPDSPKLVGLKELQCLVDDQCENVCSWVDKNIEVMENECIQIPHLLYREEHDQLLMAMQFVRMMKEDGASPLGFVPSCEVKGLDGVHPGKTFGFILIEIEERIYNRNLRDCWVLGDLPGTSMFLGINHSCVIRDHQQFKHNSIYFSDSKRLKRVCGVNDYGVFDYETKTISSAVDHVPSFKPLSSSPIWFI